MVHEVEQVQRLITFGQVQPLRQIGAEVCVEVELSRLNQLHDSSPHKQVACAAPFEGRTLSDLGGIRARLVSIVVTQLHGPIGRNGHRHTAGLVGTRNEGVNERLFA